MDEDEGWFKGKITWVCFFMSVVQLSVFLAELIKYGELDFGLLASITKGNTNECCQACSRERQSNSSPPSIL